ncbi:MAG: hypothetical protein INQ03_12065 [Candidatus Heimdallarchaeota archaeon]|nr:hypothetical protein [Candidatus Heimdallarchaeota archaeon]
MISSWLHKITLVNKVGIGLASYPETKDVSMAQLESGITSALLSFTKEIHHQELESINLEDRKVYFVGISDFVIVLEVEKEVEYETIAGILQTIKSSATWLLEDKSSDNISIKDANFILSEVGAIFTRMEFVEQMEMDDLKQDFILNDYKIFSFELSKGILNTSIDLVEIFDLETFVSKIRQHQDFTSYLISISDNRGMYLIVNYTDLDYCGAGIIVESTQIQQLISFKASYDEQMRLITQMGYEMDYKAMLTTIVENSSGRFICFKNNEQEWISLYLLKHIFGNNVSNMLNTLFLASKIILVGDPILTKQVILSLKPFLHSETLKIESFLDETSDFEFFMAGCSPSLFEEIKVEFDSAFCYDINNNRIISDPDNIFSSNEFLRSTFEDLILMPADQILVAIHSIIRDLYFEAFTATCNIENITSVDSNKRNLIKKIAIKMNPLQKLT